MLLHLDAYRIKEPVEVDELGLDEQALTATLADIEPAGALQPESLWDRKALEQRYVAQLEALAESTVRLSGLESVAAATETLLVGRAVTREILLDPLLPEELVDTDLRRQLVEAMRRYDRAGKTFWRALYKQYS